ncbi:hypothetical protein EDB19DRAFT_2024848 [Suillus lakei]|nr:hypothetical protein EDB19DRAFT_2024848 [Suillus lakei]
MIKTDQVFVSPECDVRLIVRRGDVWRISKSAFALSGSETTNHGQVLHSHHPCNRHHWPPHKKLGLLTVTEMSVPLLATGANSICDLDVTRPRQLSKLACLASASAVPDSNLFATSKADVTPEVYETHKRRQAAPKPLSMWE